MIPNLIILYMLFQMQSPEWCKIVIIACTVLDVAISIYKLCISK